VTKLGKAEEGREAKLAGHERLLRVMDDIDDRSENKE